MKYLSDYMQDKQTALFKETGAFFAFSNKQFDEQKKEGVKYSRISQGMICPTENCDKLIDGLDTIYKDCIKQDMEENSKVDIIERELANHECQIVGSPTACIEKLEDYPITKEEILAQWVIWYNKCIENDWF